MTPPVQWQGRLENVVYFCIQEGKENCKFVIYAIEMRKSILNLKLQNFDHLMRRAESLEETLIWERLRANGKASGRG